MTTYINGIAILSAKLAFMTSSKNKTFKRQCLWSYFLSRYVRNKGHLFGKLFSVVIIGHWPKWRPMGKLYHLEIMIWLEIKNIVKFEHHFLNCCSRIFKTLKFIKLRSEFLKTLWITVKIKVVLWRQTGIAKWGLIWAPFPNCSSQRKQKSIAEFF